MSDTEEEDFDAMIDAAVAHDEEMARDDEEPRDREVSLANI